MKFALPFLALILALTGHTFGSPLPTSDSHVEHHAAVLLKLNDGRTARCQLEQPRAHHAAQVVSSALVASAKMACKEPGQDSSVERGDARGKLFTCESGQNVSADEANDTIRAACNENFGLHEVL